MKDFREEANELYAPVISLINKLNIGDKISINILRLNFSIDFLSAAMIMSRLEDDGYISSGNTKYILKQSKAIIY